ncbi:MAG: hypothetical protein EOP11_14965 [Proteobacteria bacterium]|nr:MAG: hypothetical protein EOP11_14965 [Pseudomonadota bacterium]
MADDIKDRKEQLSGLEANKQKVTENEQKGGEAKKEEGKGMDPSSLMGPLAALAGMAQKKPETPAADSGVTDPAAAPPAEAKLGATSIPGIGLRKGASSTAQAPKSEPGKAEDKVPAASQYASGLSSTSPIYKDAFTGFGSTGTTPGNFSPSGGGGGGSSGASSSGPEGERATASGPHSPSEEEALSSFGGGGLNFAGGGGASSSSHSPEPEGVKDFLQDAESSMGDPLAENAEGDPSADANAGVEGEDGAELFRRVRAALERSQRKGAVLSGLSGPKDPRYR